jgi:pimeloyl-ACP methyl ester carboxylesterase
VTDEPGHVVLLHGLGRSPRTFRWAERRLRRAGFSTTNIGYPSRRAPIEALADAVAERLPADARPLHFLTHSLGGIVLRCLVQRRRPQHLGRVVMLGPPNGGSQLAARLKPRWYYRLVMGPAGQQIGTDADSIPRRLGPVDFPLGVIAGNRSLDPFRFLIGGESDGKISVEETRVEGMTDWWCLPRGHGFLLFDARVIDQAVHFFRHGRFAVE